MRKVNEVILHCSATPEGKEYSIDTIRQWHLARGFKDIGYHYIIHLDGELEKGRDEELEGAHCTGHNKNSIGICYIGGCDEKGKKAKDTRTDAQKQTLFWIVYMTLQKYNLTIYNVHCHNEYANKACPSFDRETFIREYVEWETGRNE